MSSESSTNARMKSEIGLQARHFYLLLAMMAATAAVVISPHTHPAALVLLSAAILSAGFAGAALHHALVGFFTGNTAPRSTLSTGTREALEHDKALVLRSIKELEFDRAMGKVGEADFNEIGARLRARAIVIMDDLDRSPASAPAPEGGPASVPAKASRSSASATRRCGACGKPAASEANFCPHCGGRL